MGDFNAKFKVRNGNRNERGGRLLDFAEENNLVVPNSFFLKSANRHCAWEAPRDVTQNQIDFILSSDRKIEGNCEVIIKVDISRNHRMVRASVEMNKKLMSLKKIQK